MGYPKFKAEEVHTALDPKLSIANYQKTILLNTSTFCRSERIKFVFFLEKSKMWFPLLSTTTAQCYRMINLWHFKKGNILGNFYDFKQF